MIMYGRSREDVVRWPDDPAARRALEDYLDALPRDSQDITLEFNGAGLDFTGADLSGLNLGGAALCETNLSGARLVSADLYRAWMMGAVLRDADLSRCDLRKVKGRACDAQGAILRGANLDRSEFEAADFRRADLSEVRFGGALLTGADLRGADLRDCTFGSMSTDFPKARLADCRVEGATGTVSGPVDVGRESPRLLDGDELQRWFAEHGAPQVEVWQPARA